MTSSNQSKHWTQPSAYHSKLQRNQTHIFSQEQSFVQIRKSRKGTTLNIPETFYRAHKEQPFIEKIPILPAGGCCDMEYVMYRQNALKRQISTRHNMYYTDGPQYSPSVTINIGTSQPYNLAQYHRTCQRNISYSTISINPTVVSEEPFKKKEVIPLGLYCCGNPQCEHIQSKEPRFDSFDETETGVSKPVDEKGFVYVTKPPTISPLKECWKLFTCKRKKKIADVYMPSVMTRTGPKECKVCPKADVRESDLFRTTSRNQPYATRSKLSTITESVITVSQYSSEEFVSQENKDKKEKKTLENSHKSYTGTGKMVEEASVHSGRYSSAMYHSSQFYQPEAIHRWVCKPVEENKKLFNVNKKKYLCYKE